MESQVEGEEDSRGEKIPEEIKSVSKREQAKATNAFFTALTIATLASQTI